MSNQNYMRHVGDRRARVKALKTVVFFQGTPPIPEAEWSEWAFWRLPDGQQDHLFRGKMIAEDGDKRCVRLRHATKSCEKCRYESGVKG